MKAIEDWCKSQDDVASHYSSRAPWCVMCVMCCEQRSEARDRAEREEQTWAEAGLAMVGSCQCLPAVSVGNVPAWGPSSWLWHQAISVNNEACTGTVWLLCDLQWWWQLVIRGPGLKRGVTLDLVCLRTRDVFNIGSWLLRDSPLSWVCPESEAVRLANVENCR